MSKGKSKHIRPSWDEYFLKIMETVALRATCGRGRAGCVITHENRIISTGYVGAPPGIADCDEVGHLIIQSTNENDDSGELHDHCVRTIHAEQNAIVHAARVGTALQGSTLYCRMEPCAVCARLIIAAGIKRVVCQHKYHTAGYTRDLFKEAGVRLDVLNDSDVTYET
ncbi:MAG: deoxycytidylate deaminase [Candidatus Komeilibacteria bacterium]